MESNYKNKYLKYKYLYLKKKNQIGGTRFRSIPNNGSRLLEPYLGLQCIWISIRDFIDYNRGINTTVRELKRLLGLGQETDRIEFDEYNQILRDAFERLCIGLNITVCFVYTRTDGSIAPYCLNEDGSMKPFRTINPGQRDVLYLATFGRHFELIVNASNYVLPRHHNSTIPLIGQEMYQPKIKIHDTYVSPYQVSSQREKQIAQANINLVETVQNIEYFESQLRQIQKEIQDNQNGLRNILSLASGENQTLDLDIEEKTLLTTGYEQMIRDGNSIADKIRRKLEQLRQDRASYELIIN
jgi:hypothetical protein